MHANRTFSYQKSDISIQIEDQRYRPSHYLELTAKHEKESPLLQKQIWAPVKKKFKFRIPRKKKRSSGDDDSHF